MSTRQNQSELNDALAQARLVVKLAVVLLSLFFLWTIVAATTELLPGGMGIAVCLAGAVGGVANNFRRLQELGLRKEAWWKEQESLTLSLMRLQIYVSPLIGALFAFVLYVAFAAGILKGSLFPEFNPEPYGDFQLFISNAVPADSAGAAKALFWSFVAGFSEGFVPNFISKVAKDADKETAQPNNPTQSSQGSGEESDVAVTDSGQTDVTGTDNVEGVDAGSA